MAYTSITKTRNGASAIHYVITEQKKNREEGTERVLDISGVNVHHDRVLSQMQDVWSRYRKDDGKTVQAYRITQSFGLDELNPENPEDVEKCNDIGRSLAEKLYPDKQTLIVTQADGEGGKLHNHLIVNSVGFADGKSLRAERTNWEHIANVGGEVLKSYGLEVKELPSQAWDKRSKAEIRKADNGEYVWQDDLKERISASMNDLSVTDKDSFAEYMQENHGVDIRFTNKKGREGLSYAFTDEDGKQRRRRGSTLGKAYGMAELNDSFARNKDMVARKQREDEEKKEEERRLRLEKERQEKQIQQEQLHKEPFDMDAMLKEIYSQQEETDKKYSNLLQEFSGLPKSDLQNNLRGVKDMTTIENQSRSELPGRQNQTNDFEERQQIKQEVQAEANVRESVATGVNRQDIQREKKKIMENEKLSDKQKKEKLLALDRRARRNSRPDPGMLKAKQDYVQRETEKRLEQNKHDEKIYSDDNPVSEVEEKEPNNVSEVSDDLQEPKKRIGGLKSAKRRMTAEEQRQRNEELLERQRQEEQKEAIAEKYAEGGRVLKASAHDAFSHENDLETDGPER